MTGYACSLFCENSIAHNSDSGIKSLNVRKFIINRFKFRSSKRNNFRTFPSSFETPKSVISYRYDLAMCGVPAVQSLPLGTSRHRSTTKTPKTLAARIVFLMKCLNKHHFYFRHVHSRVHSADLLSDLCTRILNEHCMFCDDVVL